MGCHGCYIYPFSSWACSHPCIDMFTGSATTQLPYSRAAGKTAAQYVPADQDIQGTLWETTTA